MAGLLGILVVFPLIAIGGIAVLYEVAALIYCAIRRFALGFAFGSAVFVQLSLPALTIVALIGWDLISPERRYVDAIMSNRAFAACGFLLVASYVATLAAGWLGYRRLGTADAPVACDEV